MSVTTYVIGFVPPDDKFKKFKQIWDDCAEVGIGPPDEVYEFFDGSYPDENGLQVELPYQKWNDEMMSGIEIKINDVPEKVKIIRFVNSY